jgi:voltage-gated potassium channel
VDTNSRNQLRLALFAILAIVPIATVGFMLTEGLSFFNALYLTVITLATIGYGDIAPRTLVGRFFVMVVVVFGLATFTFALQAIFSMITSTALREARQRQYVLRRVADFNNHYVLCGKGEMVDRTLSHLMNNARNHRIRFAPVGRDANHEAIGAFVIVTSDSHYAEKLREKGLWAILGSGTDAEVLHSAGIERARALIVMGDNDAETLLTILTARSLHRTLLITAAVLDDQLSQKMLQVGANNVIAPYAVAGSFLNNGTFRPAVNDFYSNLAFDTATDHSLMELHIGEKGAWANRTLAELGLDHYGTDVIGIRDVDGAFSYTPPKSHVVQVGEVLLAVGKSQHARTLETLANGNDTTANLLWQPLPFRQHAPKSTQTYSLLDAEQAVQAMSKHYIVCGSGLVARRAVDSLNPERPFVVLSNDNTLTTELLRRGFRVIHGDPTQEETLLRAGVKRAQAIMVTLEDETDALITVLTCRTLNKHLLITSTAHNDSMITKLELAGADRIVSPFRIAAAFTILATTCPNVSDFIKHVMFNYHSGLETAELYMETSSAWIGQSIDALNLMARYEAGVVGVRHADRKTYCYAPKEDYVIQANEVLIVIVPMRYSDALREEAHGSASKRPSTLRTRVLQSARFTPDEVANLMKNVPPSPSA